MRLLKKGVPFCWDEVAQWSFESLKRSLKYAPLLRPPDYNIDLLLYLAIVESTINMVLVQEDDMLEYHVIYYIILGLVGPEFNYSHVEKLALAAVHIVQRFHHYILIRKTTFIVIVNPFQYVLTWWVIGRNIIRWIVILQDFDLYFVSGKSQKSLVFVELISELPVKSGDIMPKDSPINGDIFLILSSDL